MNINSAALWWAELRSITLSPKFDFDDILNRAYGFHGSRMHKRVLFPRRRTLTRMIRVNLRYIAQNSEFEPRRPPVKPLGFKEYKHKHKNDDERKDEDNGKLELARPASVRAHLANWVPRTLQSYKLDMLYSTNMHGRSLNLFYKKVGRTKRTIMLVEGIGKNRQENKLIGLYASQAWHKSNHIYGDGECFLFSLNPEPACYKWRPNSRGSVDDDKNEALMEQFMIGRSTFIAMGGNKNGSCGLMLNEDFTKGESSTALGFDNEPLAGRDMSEFDVGLVEVYRFVRSHDGKGIDGEDDDVWMLQK